MTRRAAVTFAVVAVAAAIFAPDALGHAVGGGREDLPIPRWLFGWAATAVLVVSFVALAVLWPQARLEHAREREIWRVPRALAVLAGAIGVGLFGVVVWAGLSGTQSSQANITTLFVYVVVWNMIPLVSAVFGDVFAAFNPWRAIGRAFGWVAKRVAPDSLPEPLPYPERLGYWPAAAGILAFATLELAVRPSIAADPSWLAILALAYAAAMLVGMALYGVEAWTNRADAFAVFFRFIASLAPLHWQDRRLSVRPPLAGALKIVPLPGTVALLAVVIGSTSFDGLSEQGWWTDFALDVKDVLDELVSATFALEIIYAAGMIVLIALLGGLFWLGVLGMRSVDRSHGAHELAGRFAMSLAPIGLAYLVAHYYSQMVYQGQAVYGLASDPAGKGWDIFGTAATRIDFDVITSNGIWYVQVAALVIGHVAGLMLAHDRALTVYRDPARATRSQYWMLAVMVAFTSLGLWLLSVSNE